MASLKIYCLLFIDNLYKLLKFITVCIWALIYFATHVLIFLLRRSYRNTGSNNDDQSQLSLKMTHSENDLVKMTQAVFSKTTYLY